MIILNLFRNYQVYIFLPDAVLDIFWGNRKLGGGDIQGDITLNPTPLFETTFTTLNVKE